MKVCSNKDECFFGDYPTLSQLKCYGSNTPQMWLIPQLQNLSEYCGVKEKLTETQLCELSFIIATEYHYFKISELMLFFFRFKSARYGRFYGMIDPLIITTALRDFATERTAEYAHKAQRDRERKEQEDRNNSMSWEEYCRLHGKKTTDNPLKFK